MVAVVVDTKTITVMKISTWSAKLSERGIGKKRKIHITNVTWQKVH
jgi:hypothetical protein